MSNIIGINAATLPADQKNALAILTNLSDQQLAAVKQALNLGDPDTIGPQTIGAFVQLCNAHAVTLTDMGAWKAVHNLTGGALIGPTTATAVFEAVTAPKPVVVPKPPGSYAELYANYGNPADADFASRYIVSTPFEIAGGKVVHIQHHKAITNALNAVWAALRAEGNLDLIHTYDGCYVVRPIRGGTNPSIHSAGLALDLNASIFPLGSLKRQDPALVKAFTDQGFRNGADFNGRKDPMHFSYVRSPLG